MTEKELIAFLKGKGGKGKAISQIAGGLSAQSVKTFYLVHRRMVLSEAQAESIASEKRLKFVTVIKLHGGEATPWKGIASLLDL